MRQLARTKPKPKLGPLLPVIDAILEADRSSVKQRHMGDAERRAGSRRARSGGGYTVVEDDVLLAQTRGREASPPQSHPPGHPQGVF